MPDVAEADQPDNSGGCMLALYPPPDVAASLALPGGLPESEIHLTVAYAGKAADVDPQALRAAAGQLAMREPVTAMISGGARFTGGETDVVVALADSAALEDLRRDAMDRLGAQGIAIPRGHGYTPHITRQYAAPGDPDPGRLAAFPVTFGAISVVHGKDRTDYPFGDPLAPAAREAYAAGWALSGGPLTESVRAGCAAAVACALEHRGDPQILELSLDLGKLAGTWAEVYRRREDLTRDRIAKITKVWRKLIRRLNARDLVTAWKRDTAPYTAETRKEGPGKWQADEARQAALGWLYQVMTDPAYEDLAQEITAALVAAMAEGKTAALAVAADQAAALGFDWAQAYASMYAGLADLENLPGMADPWIQQILGGAATDAGRILAKMGLEGASDSEMAAAVMDAVDGEDVQAVSLMIDYAMGASMAQAALDLYTREGVQQVNVLTAGDARVCMACEAAEAQGPYPPAQVPGIPLHPRCRCTTVPLDPLPLSAYAQFLIPAG